MTDTPTPPTPPGWSRFPGPPNESVLVAWWEGGCCFSRTVILDRAGQTADSDSDEPNRDLFYYQPPPPPPLPTGTPVDWGIEL